MKPILACTAVAALMLASACTQEMNENLPEEVTLISVSLPGDVTKTVLGASDGFSRKVHWTDGDRISVNGTASNALSGVPAQASKATFTVPGSPETPYNILYPASFWKNASTITLPAVQTYAAESFAADTEPLAGYTASATDPVDLAHLCTIIQIKLKKDPGVALGTIEKVTFKGNADEQITGDFTINYSAGTLASASTADADKALTYTLSQALSESTALEMYLVVPAGTYTGGFTVVIEDSAHRTMTKSRVLSTTLNAGALVKMSEFTFVPGAISTEFSIEDITEEVVAPDGYNVKGRVVDNLGNPLQGVVVSDGTKCVRTNSDGTFYITSAIANVKFVFVSSPSGYMPPVVNGIPKFYKAKADVTPVAGVYDFGDYVMTAVANPNRFTILITADPQPRKYSGWNNDRIAYRSLDACEDLYSELADVSSGIAGRQVYGICLGDIVHEDMSLFAQYNSALATLGYPTYNIIGNHDHNPAADNDLEGAEDFESYYGPTSYSFNIGGIHFVMLDDIVMKDDDSGNLKAHDDGLTDAVWAWLQADLAFVPTSTKLMVCSHAPMFRTINSSEHSNTYLHGPDYGDLINNYSEIHAWAGHTHTGFNYNYPSAHRHKRVQVHTLARSTGELWTNEYLASGTPRGFTVVDVDNGTITWKFHPVTRQTGSFVGVTSGICSAGAPDYGWRDWNYDGSGVAVMKDGSGALTESYQMHVYPRGAYGDDYVYANVFLWDDKWNNPVWTPDGGAPVEMELVTSDTRHDLATTVFKTHYKANVGFLKSDDGYPASETGTIATLFRAPASASPNNGTVTVTDRFGNEYSRNVSW